jgi:SAM-dependent methyltransferase
MAEMPFDDESFDVVLALHTTMNVEGKAGLLSEVARVLRPGGLFGIYEVFSGDGGSPYYPVPWASGPAIDLLVTTDEMRRLLTAGGFTVRSWEDVSSVSLDWIKRSIAARKADGGAPKVSLGVVMGRTAAQKSRNMIRNLEEERIRIVQAVLRSGGGA